MKQIHFILGLLIGFAYCQTFPTPGSQAFENDNTFLQYALESEQILAYVYSSGLAQFNATDFDVLPLVSGTEGNLVLAFLNASADRYQNLLEILQARGETPLTNCTDALEPIDFSNVTEFFILANSIQQTRVDGFLGALWTISSAELRFIAMNLAIRAALESTIFAEIATDSPFPATLNPVQPLDTTTQQLRSQFESFNSSCGVFTTPLLNASAVDPESANRSIRATANDNAVLELALIIENTARVYYELGLASFSAQTISAAFNQSQSLQALFTQIGANHAAYVQALQSILAQRGATPTTLCNATAVSFNDTIADFQRFVEDAAELESIAVAFHLGSALYVTNLAVLTNIGQIATIEARHFALVDGLAQIFTNGSDSSDTGDNSLPNLVGNQTIFIDAIDDFANVTACSTNFTSLTVPILANNFYFNNATTSSSGSGSTSGSSSSASGSATASVSGSQSRTASVTEASSSDPALNQNSSASALVSCFALMSIVAVLV